MYLYHISYFVFSYFNTVAMFPSKLKKYINNSYSYIAIIVLFIYLFAIIAHHFTLHAICIHLKAKYTYFYAHFEIIYLHLSFHAYYRNPVSPKK